MATKTTRNFYHFNKSKIVDFLNLSFTPEVVYPELRVKNSSINLLTKTFVVEEIKSENTLSLSEYTISFSELSNEILDDAPFSEGDIKNIFVEDYSKITVEY